MKKTFKSVYKMRKFILAFWIFFNISSIYSQDTSLIKYLPLKVGNIWVYIGYSATIPCHGTIWYDRYKVSGTTQINGKTYFTLQHTLLFIEGACSWSSRLFNADRPIRVDSLNLNIYKSTNCGSSNEMLIDSLKSNLGDTAWECPFPQGQSIVCNDTSSFTIFGMSVPSKELTMGWWEYSQTQRYAKNIGLVYYHYYCGGSYTINLRGCVINGLVYGDTTIVGLHTVSTEVPLEYSLSQNYPNPFNPKSNIKFQIAKSGEVKLVVFDVLGREVAILVNEQLQPGTYEVEWSATGGGSNYPSGVYFYKLITADYTETRKMVLIK